MSFARIFINQVRCLSSEVLAGTLGKFHSPRSHALGVSPTTCFVCFSQTIVTIRATVSLLVQLIINLLRIVDLPCVCVCVCVCVDGSAPVCAPVSQVAASQQDPRRVRFLSLSLATSRTAILSAVYMIRSVTLILMRTCQKA
jgi:hypothetical protein